MTRLFFFSRCKKEISRAARKHRCSFLQYTRELTRNRKRLSALRPVLQAHVPAQRPGWWWGLGIGLRMRPATAAFSRCSECACAGGDGLLWDVAERGGCAAACECLDLVCSDCLRNNLRLGSGPVIFGAVCALLSAFMLL